MFKTHRIVFLAILLLAIFSSGCKWLKPSVKIPDLPILKIDKVNSFKTGDRFIISESTNSCCMYCYSKDNTLSEQMPASALFKFIETISDPADPDCAGCSSYYYSIFECVSIGTDTLRYYVIPMGAVSVSANCEALNSDSLKEQILKSDANPVTYIISVKE